MANKSGVASFASNFANGLNMGVTMMGQHLRDKEISERNKTLDNQRETDRNKAALKEDALFNQNYGDRMQVFQNQIEKIRANESTDDSQKVSKINKIKDSMNKFSVSQGNISNQLGYTLDTTGNIQDNISTYVTDAGNTVILSNNQLNQIEGGSATVSEGNIFTLTSGENGEGIPLETVNTSFAAKKTNTPMFKYNEDGSVEEQTAKSVRDVDRLGEQGFTTIKTTEPKIVADPYKGQTVTLVNEDGSKQVVKATSKKHYDLLLKNPKAKAGTITDAKTDKITYGQKFTSKDGKTTVVAKTQEDLDKFGADKNLVRGTVKSEPKDRATHVVYSKTNPTGKAVTATAKAALISSGKWSDKPTKPLRHWSQVAQSPIGKAYAKHFGTYGASGDDASKMHFAMSSVGAGDDIEIQELIYKLSDDGWLGQGMDIEQLDNANIDKFYTGDKNILKRAIGFAKGENKVVTTVDADGTSHKQIMTPAQETEYRKKMKASGLEVKIISEGSESIEG